MDDHDPDELAYYWCYAPDDLPAPLPVLATVAGMRWPVEEDLKHGKQHAALADSQVRTWTAWHLARRLCLPHRPDLGAGAAWSPHCVQSAATTLKAAGTWQARAAAAARAAEPGLPRRFRSRGTDLATRLPGETASGRQRPGRAGKLRDPRRWRHLG
jgi:hypothetical protein